VNDEREEYERELDMQDTVVNLMVLPLPLADSLQFDHFQNLGLAPQSGWLCLRHIFPWCSGALGWDPCPVMQKCTTLERCL